MFQAYVAISSKKHLDLVEANPYTMVVRGKELYLKEINKEEANGLVYYLLNELKPEEVYLFKDTITVVGVSGIVKLRTKTLNK